MTPTDEVVKDKADEHPGHIVKGRCRRQIPRAGEDEREVDIFERTDLELLM